MSEEILGIMLDDAYAAISELREERDKLRTRLQKEVKRGLEDMAPEFRSETLDMLEGKDVIGQLDTVQQRAASRRRTRVRRQPMPRPLKAEQ